MKKSLRKVGKGRYGYIDYMRKASVIKAAAMFALALSLFFGGWAATGSRESIVTVLAVVSMLPASKWTVNAIMFLRFHTRSSEFHKQMEDTLHKELPTDRDCEGLVFYDSILTIDKGGSYPVNAFACFGGNLIGFTDDPKTDAPLLNKHLKQMLKNNDIRHVTGKVYTNRQEYLARLSEIVSKYSFAEDEEQEKDRRAIALIGALSL